MYSLLAATRLRHRREAFLPAVYQREDAGIGPVPIQVVSIPGRYVSSEQPAIVAYLNGGPGKPTFAPPRPHQRGVHGRPTLVNNVETLAHVALIARYGDGSMDLSSMSRYIRI